MVKMSDLKKTHYTTGDVAKMVGRNYRTIDQQRRHGKISMTQDPTTSRWTCSKEELIRYLVEKDFLDLQAVRKGLVYARVSSHDQKENGDLERQIGRLSCEAALNGPFDIISDIGSGLNPKKKGIRRLMDRVCNDEADVIYITHKDRLTRFGYEYLEKMCADHKTEICVLEDAEDKDAQEEPIEDMMSLIASFFGKFYGMRSSRRKDIAGRAAAVIEHQPKSTER